MRQPIANSTEESKDMSLFCILNREIKRSFVVVYSSQSKRLYRPACTMMFLVLPTKASSASTVAPPAMAALMLTSNCDVALPDPIHRRGGRMNVTGIKPMLAIKPCDVGLDVHKSREKSRQHIVCLLAPPVCSSNPGHGGTKLLTTQAFTHRTTTHRLTIKSPKNGIKHPTKMVPTTKADRSTSLNAIGLGGVAIFFLTNPSKASKIGIAKI
jgi:hypothetical protein